MLTGADNPDSDFVLQLVYVQRMLFTFLSSFEYKTIKLQIVNRIIKTILNRNLTLALCSIFVSDYIKNIDLT